MSITLLSPDITNVPAASMAITDVTYHLLLDLLAQSLHQCIYMRKYPSGRCVGLQGKGKRVAQYALSKILLCWRVRSSASICFAGQPAASIMQKETRPSQLHSPSLCDQMRGREMDELLNTAKVPNWTSPISSLLKDALLWTSRFPGLFCKVVLSSFVNDQRNLLRQSVASLKRNAVNLSYPKCVCLPLSPGRAVMWLSACPSDAMHLPVVSVKGLWSGRIQVDT